MKDRRIEMVSSVRRSQCAVCGERPRVWDRAVFPMSGTLGRKALRRGRGEVSILLVGGGCNGNFPVLKVTCRMRKTEYGRVKRKVEDESFE